VAAYLRDQGIKVAEGHIVPDKLVAVRAGVGWYGKNGVVQTTRFGSWIILRSLVTNAKMEEDEELKNDCGTCESCIEACPTSAIVAPYVVDVGRRINYFSVRRVAFPKTLRINGQSHSLLRRLFGSLPKKQESRPHIETG
jgi:epoxyqueuosine reductase QueG